MGVARVFPKLDPCAGSGGVDSFGASAVSDLACGGPTAAARSVRGGAGSGGLMFFRAVSRVLTRNKSNNH
jgi:hypothetical protein